VEDALIFNGVKGAPLSSAALPAEVTWAMRPDTCLSDGIATIGSANAVAAARSGDELVTRVSQATKRLESEGHFGPYACVLGQALFQLTLKPDQPVALPQERLTWYLEGGPLVRCSTLDDKEGAVVALGGAAPIELVLAKDITLSFLQVTLEPRYVFRVYEKLALQVKEQSAIVGLSMP
jgi:uncharacterized linocin/CFP29 family protein